MSYAGAGASGPPSLRDAAATVHRDERWWLKCLGYGAAALTLVGLPLAAGFVMESLDNSRRGYPTPLPPWSDPSLRWLTGLFCLLIDFAFFVLPLLVGGLLVGCASLGLALGGTGAAAWAQSLIGALLIGAGAVVGALFLLGVAPAGRLIFAREGRVEDAISAAPLRSTTAPARRALFWRARLASLPAYLPAALLAAGSVALSTRVFPGQALAVAVGAWLTLAALIYAHLLVVQLYVAAERAGDQRTLGM